MAPDEQASPASSKQTKPAYDPPEYQIGARLSTVVLESFADGLQAQQILQWRIVKAFTPFTRSCVVLAELEADGGCLNAALPPRVILKIYDRRYQIERLKQQDERWTWETEGHARKIWLAKAAEADRSSVRKRESSDVRTVDGVDDGEKEEPEDAIFQMEHDYQESSRQYYDNELESYKRLEELQGERIPRLLASLRYDFDIETAPDLPTLPLPDSHKPHALIIEFIEDAVTADEARQEGESTWSLQRRYGRQARQALETYWKMASRDVCYRDIRGANLLFTKERSLIIDFGHCLLRRAEWDEDDWFGPTSSNGGKFIEYLHALKLRDITPCRKEWDPVAGWSRFNLSIAQHAQVEDWRKRWVKAVVEPRQYLRCLEYYHQDITQPPHFQFTPAIEKWLEDHEQNRYDYSRARPGSPSEVPFETSAASGYGSNSSSGDSNSEYVTTSSSGSASSVTSEEAVLRHTLAVRARV